MAGEEIACWVRAHSPVVTWVGHTRVEMLASGAIVARWADASEARTMRADAGAMVLARIACAGVCALTRWSKHALHNTFICISSITFGSAFFCSTIYCEATWKISLCEGLSTEVLSEALAFKPLHAMLLIHTDTTQISKKVHEADSKGPHVKHCGFNYRSIKPTLGHAQWKPPSGRFMHWP